jgi:hypothetical protein
MRKPQHFTVLGVFIGYDSDANIETVFGLKNMLFDPALGQITYF